MKSIFDEAIRNEVIDRIDSLTAQARPGWGKMSVTQMIRHCARCEEYYYGNIKIKRSLLGRLLGKSALNSILKDESSGLRKNAPTAPAFMVTESNLDFEVERKNWKQLIERYTTYDRGKFVHWFFGAMTDEQLGQFIYKHCDHHLRQFGV